MNRCRSRLLLGRGGRRRRHRRRRRRSVGGGRVGGWRRNNRRRLRMLGRHNENDELLSFLAVVSLSTYEVEFTWPRQCQTRIPVCQVVDWACLVAVIVLSFVNHKNRILPFLVPENCHNTTTITQEPKKTKPSNQWC